MRRGCVHVGLLLARGRKQQGDEREVWAQPPEDSRGGLAGLREGRPLSRPICRGPARLAAAAGGHAVREPSTGPTALGGGASGRRPLARNGRAQQAVEPNPKTTFTK